MKNLPCVQDLLLPCPFNTTKSTQVSSRSTRGRWKCLAQRCWWSCVWNMVEVLRHFSRPIFLWTYRQFSCWIPPLACPGLLVSYIYYNVGIESTDLFLGLAGTRPVIPSSHVHLWWLNPKTHLSLAPLWSDIASTSQGRLHHVRMAAKFMHVNNVSNDCSAFSIHARGGERMHFMRASGRNINNLKLQLMMSSMWNAWLRTLVDLSPVCGVLVVISHSWITFVHRSALVFRGVKQPHCPTKSHVIAHAIQE